MNVKIFRFFGRALLGFGLLLSILSVVELINSGASLREICWHEVSKLKKPRPFHDLPLAPSHVKAIEPHSGVAFWEKDLVVPDKTVVGKLDGELKYFDRSGFLIFSVCLSMALVGWLILRFHDSPRLKTLPLIVGVAPVAASILSALVFYFSLSRPLMIFKEFYSYNSTLPGEAMILFAGLVAGAVLAVVTWSVQAFFPDSSPSNKFHLL